MSSQQSLFHNRLTLVAVTTAAAALIVLALSQTRSRPATIDRPLRRRNAVRRPRGHDLSLDTEEPWLDGATESQSNAADELKGILYYIAEEQAKRKAYQHHGIRCEECGESPIRNIRWHCLNCADFDLCSTCKATTTHQRNHIFAEIKIPVPVLAQPVNILPNWYPGTDVGVEEWLSSADRRQLAHKYEYSEPEIDALADQFCCLANKFNNDQHLSVAIDKEAFSVALTSEKWRKLIRPNLLIERIFAFYDTTNAQSIGFEQFLSGVAYIRGNTRFSSLHRAIQGFDLDDDGLISRNDFVRLLRAKFDIHRLMVEEIEDYGEIEHTEDVLNHLFGSQPIGTVFQGEIPHGSARDMSGKVLGDLGNLVDSMMGDNIQASASIPSHDGLSTHAVDDNTTMNSTQADHPGEPTHVPESILNAPAVQQLSDDEKRALGLLPTIVSKTEANREAEVLLLWDIVEAAINETLDAIFAAAESSLAQALATQEERAIWRVEIDQLKKEQGNLAQELQDGASIDPLLATAHQYMRSDFASIQAELKRVFQDGAATDPVSLEHMEAELVNQPLDVLLTNSGYSIAGHEHDRSLEAGSTPDPTLPQHRPDTLTQSNSTQPSDETPVPPSRQRLEVLASLDAVEDHLQTKDGQVCLTVDQIEEIAQADPKREVEGLIKSWLSWAAF